VSELENIEKGIFYLSGSYPLKELKFLGDQDQFKDDFQLD